MTTIKTVLAGMAATLALASAQADPALWAYGAYGYDNPYVAGGSNVTVFTPGSLTQIDTNASFAAMSSLNGPVAQAFVGTSGYLQTGLANAGVSASAAAQYDFMVNSGGTFGDAVPITISGYAFFDSMGHGSASGYAKVARSSTAGGASSGSLSFHQLNWSCGNGGGDCGVLIPFTISVQIDSFGLAQVGEIGRISLSAVARIIEAAPYATQASAYVDPLITIDAGYLATHPNAQLLVNASVTNAAAPPVPEPHPAALFMPGLAAVWLMRRRVRS